MNKWFTPSRIFLFIWAFFWIIPLFPLISGMLVSDVFGNLGIMNPFSRDYLLTGTDVVINLSNDGRISINEDIGYRFKGCFREVYRTVDIARSKSGLDPGYNVPYLSSINASCQPPCEVEDRNFEIAGTYKSICDTDAQLMVNMEVLKGIVIGKDFSEFHYKVWGEKWKKHLQSLSGKIILPRNIEADDIDVYFNPLGIVKEYKTSGNVIEFSTKGFNSYLEVRLLMPKELFNAEPGSLKSSANFIFNPSLERKKAIKIQEDYEATYKLIQFGSIAFYLILFAVVIFVPYLLFKRFGKEPNIPYSAIFEREPVKGIKPYVINSLCVGKTGDTDFNAVTATLLDLIRRKHISITQTIIKKKTTIVLTFLENKKDSLTAPEQMVYDFFKRFADASNKLTWSEFLSDMKIRKNALKYTGFLSLFEKSVDKSYDIKKYFDSKGNVIFKIFCFLLIGFGVISLIITQTINSSKNFPILGVYPAIFIGILIASIVGLFLPNRVFGKFSKEGYEIYKRSLNYKKFMTDMTLLKDYPPQSVIIWEEHLVYATLFGVADKVISKLKLIVREPMVRSSSMYPIYNARLITSFNSVNSVAFASATRSSGSGFGGGFSGGGGIGGGFGGGGGGAR